MGSPGNKAKFQQSSCIQTHKHTLVWNWANHLLGSSNLSGGIFFWKSRKIIHANLPGNITNTYKWKDSAVLSPSWTKLTVDQEVEENGRNFLGLHMTVNSLCSQIQRPHVCSSICKRRKDYPRGLYPHIKHPSLHKCTHKPSLPASHCGIHWRPFSDLKLQM